MDSKSIKIHHIVLLCLSVFLFKFFYNDNKALPDRLAKNIFYCTDNASPDEKRLIFKLIAFLANQKNNKKYIYALEKVLDTRPFDDFQHFVIEMAKDLDTKKEYDPYDATLLDAYKRFMLTCSNNRHINMEDCLKKTENTATFNLLKELFKYSFDQVSNGFDFVKVEPKPEKGEVTLQIKNTFMSASYTSYLNNFLVHSVLNLQVKESIQKWWNGEISGKRCAKEITDTLSVVGGGLAGFALCGALFGPVGLACGIPMAIIGGLVANKLSDWFTTNLFGLPRDKALEHAFEFMGLHHTASIREINEKFRKLILIYHPDKGGKQEDFYKLQAAMSVIRMAKGFPLKTKN